MPQALGLLIGTLASSGAALVGASVAFQAVFAQAAVALFSAIGPLALYYGASKLLTPGAPHQRPSDGQQEIKQAVPPRSFHYGTVKVSGPLAFYETRGGTLVKDILISSRQIDSYQIFYLNDRVISVDGSHRITTAPYVQAGNYYAHLVYQLGASGQTSNTLVNSQFTEWTSAHRLRGIANVAVSFLTPTAEQYPTIYPNGEPQFATVIRAALLYDPRQDTSVGGSGPHRHNNPATWEWDDNAGLAVLDYLTWEDGYNRPVAKIDLSSFMAFADVCDDAIALAAGGTEPRYRVATTVFLTEARKDVLARLLAACDGQLYYTAAGKIAIRGGVWEEPTVTIDHDLGHILEAKFTPTGALDRYTELAITFLNPALGYVEDEADPWQDVDAVADGIVETQPADFTQVPSASQARRLAKIRMVRENPDWTVELRTNLYGLNAIGERVVQLKWPELAIDGPFFVAAAPSLADDQTGLSLTLTSARSAAYDWTTAEEGTSSSVPPDISPDLTLTPPAIVVTEIATRVIQATWTPDAALNRNYQVRYRPDPGSTHTSMTVAGTRDEAVSGTVAVGDYQVTIRITVGTAVSDWSAEQAITIV